MRSRGEGLARFEWNAGPIADTGPATIDYGNWTLCSCGNPSTSDGFAITDRRGALRDDQATATGLICRACGNFYPVDPMAEGSQQVPPTVRFALEDPRFKAADDEQWERLYGE